MGTLKQKKKHINIDSKVKLLKFTESCHLAYKEMN